MSIIRYALPAFFLVLTACGGSSSTNDPVATVTVSPGDSVYAQKLATTKNVALTITLKSSDGNSQGRRFSVTSMPANGSLTGELSGFSPVMVYTPNLDFSGDDGFEFEVREDDGSTGTASVTIVVYDTILPDTDTDGDGLPDIEEINKYGTNPELTDTDGDSLSDFQEAVVLAFDADTNNYKFNPLIADLPELSIDIIDLPDVSINYTTTNGSSQSFSSSTTATDTTVTTTTRGGKNSYTLEVRTRTKLDTGGAGGGAYAGAKAGVGTGVPMGHLGPQASAGAFAGGGYVNYSEQKETNETVSSSFYWSQSQQRTNTLTRQQSESFATNNSVTDTGASLTTTIRVRNTGNVPFRLENLSLVGSYLKAGDLWRNVGTLSFDNSGGSFPATTLAANSSTGVMVFSNRSLDVGLGNRMLESTGLDVDISSSEIVQADGKPFAFNQLDLDSRTAKIVIDYAGVRPTEKYQVAVVSDSSRPYRSLGEVLQLLKLSYKADSGKVTAIRDVQSPAGDPDSFWMALHMSSNGLQAQETIYDIQGATSEYPNARIFNQAAIESIQIRPGDVIVLGYIEDGDNDGLMRSTEIALQTDPDNPDSDGDGLNDGDEIAGWNALVTDELILNSVGNGKAAYWVAVTANADALFPYAGDLDEVRVWEIARPASDIAADMANALTSPYPAGLLAYWPMDSLQGSAAGSPWPNTDDVQPDASGNGHHLALRNTANNSAPVLTAGGPIGGYITLDGVDDILSAPSQLFMTPASVTLEARFRTTASGVLFAYHKANSGYYVPAVYIGNDGLLRGMFWGAAPNNDSRNMMISTAAVNDGQWHHVALVYDDANSEQHLYLDGALLGTLSGVKDRFAGSYFKVASNPSKADTDGDGVNDGDEMNASMHPQQADTDGDWLQDDVDSEPNIPLQTDVSNMSSTRPTAVSPQTTISFDVPSPANTGSGVSDYAVMLLEQVAQPGRDLALQSLPADNASFVLNDMLTCTDTSQCWKVIAYSFSNGSGIRPGQKFSIVRSIPADNLERSYIVLVRVNGKWRQSSQRTSQLLGGSVKITVKGISLITVNCYEGNYRCEYAWDMYLNKGENGRWQYLIHKQPDNAPISEAGGGNILAPGTLNSSAATRSFVIPDVPGSCFNIQSQLTEMDGSSVYKRTPYVATFCNDDGWASRGVDGVSKIEGIYTSWAGNGFAWGDVHRGTEYRGHLKSRRDLNGLPLDATNAGPGFRGSFVYFTPVLWSKGGYGEYARGYHEISARMRYYVTIEDAP